MNIPYYYTPEYFAERDAERAEATREKSAAWDKPNAPKKSDAYKRYNAARSFFDGVRALSVSLFE